ncbi:efflux RND transporter permease subunit [Gimesia chilikensis]|uniref:Cation efflux system protein CusA n=1 Tax=Gimesia chilikensis TaxID=2605989 RepID=A0A517PLM5_9PLAN|nr:efflux RND transporter permease subunit [Gimesia chilikensis]QDT20276.1 Cation efflux system protein CusA [Gimesia chilikensis]QDU02373.1 Cation efflux system protein CusA [Gimesia chilikensis]
MIRSILDFCLRQRLLIVLLSVGLIGWGWYSAQKVPIDAIPNVGENQVIVLAEWSGRSPKDVEDQITYPLSIALQAVPGSRSVRGKSMFGFSFVQVTFDDDVDFYWARSRVVEQLTTVTGSLPEGVVPTLAPDATALGQIYYYVLEPPAGMDLAELRSKQDFFIKYALQSVDGVAEVASIGGYVKQYQVEVDPDELRYHNIPLSKVIDSVKAANIDVGAKTVETSGMEFIVRGKGFIGADKTEQETIEQINNTVITTSKGVPIRVSDVAQVQTGPAFRRGALDLNGQEAVGGVVVMRYGENPRKVIERVQAKIASLESELGGIKIQGIYDRSLLIDETVSTLTEALIQETIITIAVMVLFLLHIRASIIIAITLPMAVLMSFIAMKTFGVDANIMSLAGIAIAIGTMVDMGIIILENIYGSLAEWEASGSPGGPQQRLTVIRESAAEVIPAVITAVSTTIISFLPVFFLTGRDHRLFTPLAWTKSFALISSLIVAVVILPMLCRIFLRSTQISRWGQLASGAAVGCLTAALCWFVWGDYIAEGSMLTLAAATLFAAVAGFLLGWWVTSEKIRSMEENPASRFVRFLYAGRLKLALKHKLLMLSFPALIVVLGAGAWVGLPTVLKPVEKVVELLGADLNQVPGYVDAKHVFTGLKSDDWIALDEGSWFYMPSLYPAASFSQAMEILQAQDTLIKGIPEVEHVLGKIGRVESALDPAPAAMVETYVMLKPRAKWREGMTARKIWDEINQVATLPGVTPASPLQPIEGRVVMLQSGIKASMAIRVYGDDLEGLSKASLAVAEHLKQNRYVNAGTVNPDIVMGKPYYEFEVDREEAARYGMTTMMVNQIVSAGLGGLDVTTTVEGRERYPIQVRFERSVRKDLKDLRKVSVVTHGGDIVPLKRLADVTTTWGPGAINSEDARLVAHVAFSPSGASGDLETVEQVMSDLRTAREDGSLTFPRGNFELQAVGSFQNQIEANQRLMWIIPTVLLVNLLIIYLGFQDFAISAIVFSGIPVAFAGGMITVAWMGVDMNTAVWVGFIALFGIAVDDGVVMATYIQQTLKRQSVNNITELREAIYTAGLKRIRPCVMTTLTTIFALLPVLMSHGRGADVARAMALPVLGGMLVEPFTTFIVPAIYCAYLEFKMNAGLSSQALHQELPQSGSQNSTFDPALSGPAS